MKHQPFDSCPFGFDGPESQTSWPSQPASVAQQGHAAQLVLKRAGARSHGGQAEILAATAISTAAVVDDNAGWRGKNPRSVRQPILRFCTAEGGPVRGERR